MRQIALTGMVILAGLLAGIVVPGCGGRSEKEEQAEQVVLNWIRAVNEGDQKLYLASIQCADEEMAVAMFEEFSFTERFYTAYVAEYGQDALGSGKARQLSPDPSELKGKIRIEEKDGSTVAFVPGNDEAPLRLIEVDGRWKVDLTSCEDMHEEGRNNLLAFHRSQARAAQNAIKKIGQAEYADRPGAILQEMFSENLNSSIRGSLSRD